MDKEQIIKYLDSYKQIPAMVTLKQVQIADLEERLQFARENHSTTPERNEIRKTDISKPTEKKAIMDMDGCITPIEKELSHQIRNCYADLRALEYMPRYVDAWLSGLIDRERSVIELRHFDRLTFEQIGESVGFEKTTIKRVYCQAMEKIERMACY